MKNNFRYITEEEAINLYRELVNLHFSDIDIIDKANRLRSQFDIILRMAFEKKYEDQQNDDKKNKNNSFADLLDDLFAEADERGEKLKTDLNTVRKIFNKKVQHIYNLLKFRKKSSARNTISENEYKFCLRTIAVLISFLSGTPIPSSILDASLLLEYKEMKRSLDIVIILELYDDLNRINKGVSVLKNLKKMNRIKNKLGFNKLNVSVVVYSQPVSVLSNNNLDSTSSSLNDALQSGLKFLDSAVTKWIDDREGLVDKPWLMWLCFDLKKEISQEHIKKINEMLDAKIFGFYPIDMNNGKVTEIFKEYWPNCKPILMNPDKSNNFFNTSILLTIQRMQNK